MVLTDQEEIRKACLEMAVKIDYAKDPAHIVQSAKLFYRFIAGNDEVSREPASFEPDVSKAEGAFRQNAQTADLVGYGQTFTAKFEDLPTALQAEIRMNQTHVRRQQELNDSLFTHPEFTTGLPQSPVVADDDETF